MLKRSIVMVQLGLALLLPAEMVGALSAGQSVPEDFEVRVNGVGFALRTVVVTGEPEVLAQRLEGRWGARQPVSSRLVLGRQRGPFHETLSLMPGPRPGLSQAIVAVQDLRIAPATLPRSPVPLPPGAAILNVVQFGDAGRAQASFTIATRGAALLVLRSLQARALDRGWLPVTMPPRATSRGAAFWVRRGHQELVVIALPAADARPGPGRLVALLTDLGAGPQR